MAPTYTFEGLPPVDDALRKTLTEYSVGILLGLMAACAVLTQCVNYLYSHPDDRKRFRRLVYAISILTIAHTGCSTADYINVMAVNFGDASVFYRYSPMYSCMFILDGIIAGLIQGFYAWRVWSLFDKHRGFLVLFPCLIAFTFGTWLYMGISVQRPGKNDNYFTPSGAILSFIAPVVCDIIITVFMLISISRARETGHKSTKAWLLKVALLTVTTNAFTTAFCLTQLAGEVSIFTSADGQPWPGVNILLPSLPHVYSATLLTWLMAKKPSEYETHVSGSLPSGIFTVETSGGAHLSKAERQPTDMEVNESKVQL